MTVHYYPDINGDTTSSGSVKKFIERLAKSDPALFSMVMQTIDQLSKPGATIECLPLKWRGRLKGIGASIFELRIPPKKSGGVVRLYCCYDKRSINVMIILDGEVKRNNKSEANIKEAVKRFKVI